jgi:AhpD family alkylhydroperoxidase
MLNFPVHKLETASDAGKAALEVSVQTYGGIPNLHGVMATAPRLLEAYQALNKLFMQNSLSNSERHVVWLTVNYENACTYCMAAHSMIAVMGGLDAAAVEALRTGADLDDPKLQTLRSFTRHMLITQGWPEKTQLDAMEAAGYSSETLLDVIMGIGMKTLSNYTNHLADTPLDASFADYRWEQPQG